jgi:hypothetical protein
MLSALVESQPFTFRPRIQLDPAGTASLSQALNARLYEKARTESEKRNYHVINAFSLALSRLEYWKAAAKTSKPKPPALGWMSA